MESMSFLANCSDGGICMLINLVRTHMNFLNKFHSHAPVAPRTPINAILDEVLSQGVYYPRK